MRYTLVPKDVQDASTVRRDQARRARELANSRFASEQRKQARSRNFWTCVTLGLTSVFILVLWNL